jgi:hypothetical protein
MSMDGLAFVFINFVQAGRCGHVAWGFLLDPEAQRYYFGSTDHLLKDPWWDLLGWIRYAHVDPHGHNDWWSETGTHSQMIAMMHKGHHIRYHAAKVIPVRNALPDKGFEKAEALKSAGWSVLNNNCVHQTYSVLTEYGADLPAPGSAVAHVIPKKWFAAIAGDYIDLASVYEKLQAGSR